MVEFGSGEKDLIFNHLLHKQEDFCVWDEDDNYLNIGVVIGEFIESNQLPYKSEGESMGVVISYAYTGRYEKGNSSYECPFLKEKKKESDKI